MIASPDLLPGLPHNKAELLDRIDREWNALEDVLSLPGHEQMEMPDAGGWSAKDNLAHLAEWERYLRLHHIRGLPPHEVMGVAESTYQALDEDELNAILFERNRGRSINDVIDGLRDSHEQVLRDLADLSFDEMTRQRYPEDPQAEPLLYWIAANTFEHYREHRAAIEGLAGRG